MKSRERISTPRDDQNRAERLGISVSELHRRQRNAERAGKFMRRVVAPVAAVALAAGLYNHTNETEQNAKAKTEAAALAETNTARNDVLVFHAGVNVRTIPRDTDSGAEEGNSIIASTVQEGEVLRIDRALRFVDEDNNDNVWVGFVAPDKGESDGKDNSNPERIYWINMTELDRQGEARGQSYYDVYDYPTTDEPGPLQVSIDSDGNFNGTIDGHGGPVGLGSTLPVEAFELEVQRENLELSHGK